MNRKSIRNAAALGGVLCGAVTALALTACFNLANLSNQNDPGDDSLINVQIDIGDGGAAARSLSPEVAEKYFNYMEVIFVKAKDTGNIDGNLTDFYRAAGFTNQKIRIAIPAGTYDNADNNSKAIMLAGVRNLQTGECVLLATGVISASERNGGSTTHEAAEINKTTTKVIFRLTALTAAIKAAPDSAFKVPVQPTYRTTKITGVEYPYFVINPATIKDDGITIEEATTTATLTLTGWGADPDKGENNTQQFLYLDHDPTEEFVLAGIGLRTDEGDDPLYSTADITWKLTNTPGAMTAGDTINIQFTSKSTVGQSGMGWLMVRVPVRAFKQEKVITQVWQVGSGVLRNELNAGADAEGAGIVILHGNKKSEIGVGEPDNRQWVEYVLDLSAPPCSVPGVWEYKTVSDEHSTDSDYDQPVYTLLGKPNTLVRIIGTTGSTDFITLKKPMEIDARRVEVAAGAEVKVILDNAKIYSATDNYTPLAANPPFLVKKDAKVTMYLANGSVNELINPYNSENTEANFKVSGLLVEDRAELTIKSENEKRDEGSLIAVSSGGDGVYGAGIMVNDGGTLTIEKGVKVTAAGSGLPGQTNESTGAGIGVFGSATLNIAGGTVIAVGGKSGAGIGGSSWKDDSPQPVGTINISGGVVIAKSQEQREETGGGGAGIGSGGRLGSGSASPNAGGTVNISGGVVIAEGGSGYTNNVSPNDGGAGIGGGGSSSNSTGESAVGGEGGNVTISGGTVYARGGKDAPGIGPGKGSSATQPYGTATNLTITPPASGLVFASSIMSTTTTYDAGGHTTDGILVGTSLQPTVPPPNELEFSAPSGRLITFINPNDPTNPTPPPNDPTTIRYYHDTSGGHFPSYTVELKVLLDFTVPAPAPVPNNTGILTIPKYMTFTMQFGKIITNNGTVDVQRDGTLKLNGDEHGPGEWKRDGTIIH